MRVLGVSCMHVTAQHKASLLLAASYEPACTADQPVIHRCPHLEEHSCPRHCRVVLASQQFKHCLQPHVSTLALALLSASSAQDVDSVSVLLGCLRSLRGKRTAAHLFLHVSIPCILALLAASVCQHAGEAASGSVHCLEGDRTAHLGCRCPLSMLAHPSSKQRQYQDLSTCRDDWAAGVTPLHSRKHLSSRWTCSRKVSWQHAVQAAWFAPADFCH